MSNTLLKSRLSRLVVLPPCLRAGSQSLPLLGLSILPNQQQCCLWISVSTCRALSYLSYCNCKANKAEKERRQKIFRNFFSSFLKYGPLRYPVFPLFHFPVSSPRGLWGSRPCLRRKLEWELWENSHLQSEVEDLGLSPVPCGYDDFKAVCHVFLYNFVATKIGFALKNEKVISNSFSKSRKE